MYWAILSLGVTGGFEANDEIAVFEDEINVVSRVMRIVDQRLVDQPFCNKGCEDRQLSRRVFRVAGCGQATCLDLAGVTARRWTVTKRERGAVESCAHPSLFVQSFVGWPR